MNTPIIDFVTEYFKGEAIRFHMPGHKGNDSLLGAEHRDITEIDGAGNLWAHKAAQDDIIAQSEQNASEIFGCATFYSTEGSSLAIRGMLFMIKKWALINGSKPLILAGRNAHKTFVNTAAVLDIPVKYMFGTQEDSFVSCNLSGKDIEKYILENTKQDKPTAVYITTPDYLGNVLDVYEIAKVCHRYDVMLLVDNAHGAYLKFVKEDDLKSFHPIDLGADMCCDSAHKTLPALTGAAYLHVSNNTDDFFRNNAKEAMGMFGSTSPSYLILQSLDLCNRIMSEGYEEQVKKLAEKVAIFKSELAKNGYIFVGNEPLKITVDAKAYGYSGDKISSLLMEHNIYPEYYDEDYVVFMVSTSSRESDFDRLLGTLLGIPKKSALCRKEYIYKNAEDVYAMSPNEAIYSESEFVRAEDSVGRILAEPALSCPPCVPICMAGEKIETVPEGCDYVKVVKNI